MENNKEHLETLSEIKGLMHRSSKFASFSGISGIAAGMIAVIGAVIASFYLHIGFLEQTRNIMNRAEVNPPGIYFIFTLALVIFTASLLVAVFISSRKAKRNKMIFWDSMAKRVFINYFIFLFTGGVFCCILFYYGIYFLIVASMLIFYGLALINVSKFTFNEIAQLGIIEICLGIFASFVTVYPLLIWVIGFGILHIVYGTYVYYKYERDNG